MHFHNMTVRSQVLKILQQEDINFLLTNRVPRRLLTRFVGWLSRIEQPQVRDVSIWAWQLFSDLDLSEAKKTSFSSVRDCFTRELKDGARPIDVDPSIMTSPCDAIVGACGAIEGTKLYQIKGFPYRLEELLHDPALTERYRDGRYVTLRLTASMYHRFHAPCDGRVERVTYIAGDTWNVNPIALKRVEKLFCRNERAILQMRLAGGALIALVPVAAILVAGIRLNFLSNLRDLDHDGPKNDDCPKTVICDAAFRKGDEMGWFEHGSTIIVFAPKGFALCAGVRDGVTIRMGQPLMRMP
jgi:phosphatidylserine decarboxylase